MFGQPFVLQQLGASGIFSNPAALDFIAAALVLVGVASLVYGGYLLAKAPDAGPPVPLRPEHRRKRRLRRR